MGLHSGQHHHHYYYTSTIIITFLSKFFNETGKDSFGWRLGFQIEWIFSSDNGQKISYFNPLRNDKKSGLNLPDRTGRRV